MSREEQVRTYPGDLELVREDLEDFEGDPLTERELEFARQVIRRIIRNWMESNEIRTDPTRRQEPLDLQGTPDVPQRRRVSARRERRR